MGDSGYCLPPGFSLPPPIAVQPLPPTTEFETSLKSYPWYNKTTIAIKASVGGQLVFQHAHHANDEESEILYDTKIRIASVTKLFTVLAILLSREEIGWEQSITKYVPGLDEAAYADVTIGALAGQTSGLGRFVRNFRGLKYTITDNYEGLHWRSCAHPRILSSTTWFARSHSQAPRLRCFSWW